MSENWKTDPGYDSVHARRFELSLDWISCLLPKGAHVLELGAPGTFTRLLREARPDVTIANRENDLRYPVRHDTPAEASSEIGRYDAVLCMEVLEHIHDQEAEKPTEWRATGTGYLLGYAHRMLKTGGFIFITTPNACGYHAIHNALTMQAPAVYRPHVREYAPQEVAAMVQSAGFTIERFATETCWAYGTLGDRTRLQSWTDSHYPSEHRGDDIFLIARK